MKKVPGLIDKLAGAIAQYEGYYKKGSRARRNNNPGNLRNAPWLKTPMIIDGFWATISIEQGTAGLYHQIALDIARGFSLLGFISKYAPSSDGNNTKAYALFVARKAGIDLKTPMQNYLDI